MSNKEPIQPFLKWVGGKRQLIDKLLENMPIKYNRYYEVFSGGASLLLHLQPSNAVLNDTNPALVNCYRQLQCDATAVLDRVRKYDAVGCDKKRYLSMRDDFNKNLTAGSTGCDFAALMMWINRHCFNGLYRVNSKGQFNVAYNNKTNGASVDETNCRKIGDYLNSNHVDIRCMDFEAAVADAQPGDFVYLDPPYVPMTDTANFTAYTKDGFSYQDHVRVAELARKLKAKGIYVMISNNDNPTVRKLYSDFYITSTEAKRNISCKTSSRKCLEVIITSYDPATVNQLTA